MGNKKIVLAYSGGLDTSVAVKWLTDKGFDVIADCMDVGEGKDLNFIHDKALQVGAVESVRVEFYSKRSLQDLESCACRPCQDFHRQGKPYSLMHLYHRGLCLLCNPCTCR